MIYVSSGAFAAGSIGELIRRCVEAGVQGLELSSGLACDEAGLRQLEAARDTHGLSLLVHNYFPAPAEPFVLNLAALDSSVLERSKAHCRNAIALCERLGSPFFSVHSGFAVTAKPDDLGDPSAWRARHREGGADIGRAKVVFRESVSELADHAGGRGIRLLLENNIVWPELVRAGAGETMLLASGDEIQTFFSDLNHEYLGLLVDVGHAKVSASALGFTPEAFMAAVADRVEAFHLSDNDGRADTNSTFGPDAWFAPYLRELPEAACVIEAYRLEPEQVVRQLQIVEEMRARAAVPHRAG